MALHSWFSRCGIIAAFLFAPLTAPAADGELTLQRAERLAVDEAPWLQHHRASAAAAAERVAYQGRLPDPQLLIGAVNLPADSGRLNQEDMTMLMVGVRQSFPPGNTLKLREQRAEQELSREQSMSELERRNLLRQVRVAWLELFYQDAARRQLDRLRQLQQQQLDAAQGRYRAAQDPALGVHRTRAALARLDERAPMIEAKQQTLRAELRHWIGDAAQAALPEDLPTLPAHAEFDPTHHPEWLAARAGQAGMRLDAELARQDYKPGMMLDLSYGSRQAAPNGMERSNLVTAMVTVDLPLFRANRQDRRLAEKLALADGAEYETEDKRRILERMYQTLRAEQAALAARVRIVAGSLLPALQREAQVTSSGFARDRTDVREAQMRLLDAELELVRLRVDQARNQAELLFLAGEKIS